VVSRASGGARVRPTNRSTDDLRPGRATATAPGLPATRAHRRAREPVPTGAMGRNPASR
jgi:hypothetical protein